MPSVFVMLSYVPLNSTCKVEIIYLTRFMCLMCQSDVCMWSVSTDFDLAAQDLVIMWVLMESGTSFVARSVVAGDKIIPYSREGHWHDAILDRAILYECVYADWMHPGDQCNWILPGPHSLLNNMFELLGSVHVSAKHTVKHFIQGVLGRVSACCCEKPKSWLISLCAFPPLLWIPVSDTSRWIHGWLQAWP